MMGKWMGGIPFSYKLANASGEITTHWKVGEKRGDTKGSLHNGSGSETMGDPPKDNAGGREGYL